ncbi:MAG: Ig-like domain-containing protein [Pirellulales bacterium]|nr:Ig-like domain-containing protein [Pirellulales bacterium]
MKTRPFATALGFIAIALILSSAAVSQDGSQDTQPAKVVVSPEKLEIKVGESAQLTAKVLDKNGNELQTPVTFFSLSRRQLTVTREGQVTATRPGEFSVLVMPASAGGRRSARGTGTGRGNSNPLRVTIPVKVAFPPVTEVSLTTNTAKLYAGLSTPMQLSVKDEMENDRNDVNVSYESSAPDVAEMDPFGNLVAHKPGRFTITATAENVTGTFSGEVVALPIKSFKLEVSETTARTGDVLNLKAIVTDADGNEVPDLPITYAFTQDRQGQYTSYGGAGQIENSGRFVAEVPGAYTLIAQCGPFGAKADVEITPRNVQRRLEVVGRGAVTDTHTSDLWVWEGVDGRDYAVTGTWGANGDAHFFDVTDPENIRRVSTVTVDARTVNDVKVSEDGRICIISREGASNRRNGIVIYDVSDPTQPELLSEFNDNLTGGVHNLFISNNHVYAINNGTSYDIINIDDPRNPRRVAEYELETPRHAVHDVWVVDGLAYSSNWANGLHVVDVGNGIKGGSPANPELVYSYIPPNVAHHAAFPYTSSQTGKKYVICGDERFPFGLSTENSPTIAGGYLHFVDVTDPENCREVARYEVPEAGSHNYWVEGDILYAAMYNAGVRVVDISGDLMGDLGRQGREIAQFKSFDHEGYIANAPMVWGPQPYKGNIFFSDWNTGLWCVRLSEGRR